MFTPGAAYWNQRLSLAKLRERISSLSQAVGRTLDLTVPQFTQLLAAALEFQPDLILELGRNRGNSTCAFTEAANQLPSCRVLSLCLSDEWTRYTVPKLRGVVPSSWFAPLDALRRDILTFDFESALSGAKRVLLFWDAHGTAVAECVLGRVMPLLDARQHVVLMHDLSDTRYHGSSPDYAGQGLWNGQSSVGRRVRIGIVDSAVAQSISIQDFATRNRITLDSADHSFDVELSRTPGRLEEMQRVLGEDLFSLQAHWFWFTLNEHPGPYTYPRFTPETWRQNRFVRAVRTLLHGS